MGKARDAVADADEYVEIEGSGGGDFPPIHDWEDDGALIGLYVETKTVQAKGKDRTIHTFQREDGELVSCWGAAILDSRLEELDPTERPAVKVVRPGTKVATKKGNQAWEFKVFVKRSALNPNR